MRISRSFHTPVALMAVLLGGERSQATELRVRPIRADLRPGATQTFHATQLDPPAPAPPAITWTLVDEDGKAAPASFGTLGPDGVYRAPAALPAGANGVLVKATLLKDPSVSGTALVTLPVETKTAAPGGIALGNLPPAPALARLRPRPGLEIPNPPYSLEGLSDERKMKPETTLAWLRGMEERIPATEWETWRKTLREPDNPALPRNRYLLFHGLGMDSQRRLLNAYYQNVSDLTSAEVFSLSPWVVLGLRNLISMTLIDVTRPKTFYTTGFIVEAPLETFYSTTPHDGHVPMEGTKGDAYDQRTFRQQFKHKNPHSPEVEALYEQQYLKFGIDQNLQGQPHGTKRRLVKEFDAAFEKEHPPTFAFGPAREFIAPSDVVPRNGIQVVNEVATFSRVTRPDQHVTLKAVAIVMPGSTYQTGVHPEDKQADDTYEAQARALARELGLPFLDLRPKAPAHTGTPAVPTAHPQ